MKECLFKRASELASSPSAVRPLKANATMMSLPQARPSERVRNSTVGNMCKSVCRLFCPLVNQQPDTLAHCRPAASRTLLSLPKFTCAVSVQTSSPGEAKEPLCSTIRRNLPLSNYWSPFKDLGKGQNNTLSFRRAVEREDTARARSLFLLWPSALWASS